MLLLLVVTIFSSFKLKSRRKLQMEEIHSAFKNTKHQFLAKEVGKENEKPKVKEKRRQRQRNVTFFSVLVVFVVIVLID